MAISGKSDMTGLRELRATFAALKADAQLRLCRGATNAAAQVIKAAAQEAAPVAAEPYVIEGVAVRPGNIGRNVIVKRLPPDETPLTSEHIVVIRGKARYGYASRLGSIIEYGKVDQTPRPWFRPAYDLNKERAFDAMKGFLIRNIPRAAKRGGGPP